MNEQKIIMQQQQTDGSYQELWPKNDSWSKVQTLSDLTRELLGLDSSSIPDDAFIALCIGKDSKAYRVKVTYPNGQPAVGFTVGGLTAFPALRLVTNEQGIVMGSSTSSTPTITVAQKYNDVKSYSGSFTSTRMITDCEIVLEWGVEFQISSSTSIDLSNICPLATKIHFLIIAAGGGGGSRTGGSYNSWYKGAGSGGGGGQYYIGEKELKKISSIDFAVGSGGNGGYTTLSSQPGNGGNTTITFSDSSSFSAQGGKGGSNLTYSTETVGSYSELITAGRVDGGEGNGTGATSGQVKFYWDSDPDDRYVYNIQTRSNALNPSAGEDVTFNGKSYSTGGGGRAGGIWVRVHTGSAKWQDYFTNTSTVSTASDYGGGGDAYMNIGINDYGNGNKGKNGFCCYYFSYD